ncbi:unnamed protein product [Effrenium voratum]|uniref:C2H2-type domain-containing protein n=1 Tax=Effrenium voratum TaxID=2562239 RepID=A0AA36JGX6_9DINO|nr:unnamed protein product [Effrenium voratum]CAJ1404788.1 unnamed protein product [Effrenium voratum]CAJ1424572.1 unnamed protein product [Effrenium voratum]|mmetsp:Transcript_98225/g.233779  ORF Transcript_98225/g.233779 Transcript_98225/m.233779 type:complete len:114 (-) Transcript_98225:75-416(-)
MRGNKHTGRTRKNQNKKTRPSVIAQKRRNKDIDQVHEDLKTPKRFEPGTLPRDEDLPGLGQFYCISCDRFFESAEVKAKHEKSKLHKRRLQKASDEPHTQRDAEMAVGLATER